MKYIQIQDRHQVQILSLDSLIAADNPVRVLDAFIDKLNLQAVGFHTRDERSEGRPSFQPTVMLKVYLYGYYNRVRSSRKLEAECQRNIEMQWLTGSSMPCYHTIADFRKDHSVALKNVFRLFTSFLNEHKMFGKELVAIDGSKFRAQNSKKNNYNQKKLDRHFSYIENKTNEYLQQLEDADKEDLAASKGDKGSRINRAEVKEKLKKLKERELKYRAIEEQCKASADGQVSATDPESKSLIINKNIVEVSYNVQTVVDGEHKLIAAFETTNRTDAKALTSMVEKGLDGLELKDGNGVTVLADKGYHNGEELEKSAALQVKTIVAFREQPTVKHLEKEYLVSNFEYNKAEDIYICPQGNEMRSNGRSYKKNHKSEKRKTGGTVLVKHYKTTACQDCPVLKSCTKNTGGRGRVIERGQYQDSVDANNKRVINERKTYNLRQAIVEHPFGTIKRSWGYSYTLLKSIRKVNGEMSLIFLVYNLRRSMTIFGVKDLLEKIKTWKPPVQGGFLSVFNEISGSIRCFIENDFLRRKVFLKI